MTQLQPAQGGARVSVITPCYNAAPFVERLIASVRSQTFQAWEHILVDDGSTDDTGQRIERAIADEPRSRLVRQSNRGVCAARNAGYRASTNTTEFVYFCDADDMLHPQLLEKAVSYLDAHPEAGLVFCAYQYIDEHDRPLPTRIPPRYVPTALGVRAIPDDEPRTPFVSAFCGGPIFEPNCVLRRSVYDLTPGWDEGFGQGMEGECLVYVGLLAELHYLPEKLYLYRQHPRQHSRTALINEEARRRVLDKWKHMPGLTSAQRREVAKAVHFFENRLSAWLGFRYFIEHARKGEWARAVRFFGGAIRRYLRSFTRPHVGQP